jgi:hypothetical protein
MEIWKPVLGYEDSYEVSNMGRVRSIDREWVQKSKHGTEYIYTKKGKLLKPGKMKSGHVSVAIGRGHSRLVHSLVMEAFVGERPKGKEVLHNNGVADDNRLENLRYGTRSENILDAVKHGTWMSEARLKHCKNLRNYRKDINAFAPRFRD